MKSDALYSYSPTTRKAHNTYNGTYGLSCKGIGVSWPCDSYRNP